MQGDRRGSLGLSPCCGVAPGLVPGAAVPQQGFILLDKTAKCGIMGLEFNRLDEEAVLKTAGGSQSSLKVRVLRAPLMRVETQIEPGLSPRQTTRPPPLAQPGGCGFFHVHRQGCRLFESRLMVPPPATTLCRPLAADWQPQAVWNNPAPGDPWQPVGERIALDKHLATCWTAERRSSKLVATSLSAPLDNIRPASEQSPVPSEDGRVAWDFKHSAGTDPLRDTVKGYAS